MGRPRERGRSASPTAATTTRGSPGRVALKLWDGAAFGASIQHSYSQNAYVDGLWGVTAALSYRPDPHIGLSAVAHDFNEPSPALVPSLSHVAPSQPVLDGRYALAMSLRPAGERSVDLGFEIQYYQGSNLWVPRGTLGVDVPLRRARVRERRSREPPQRQRARRPRHRRPGAALRGTRRGRRRALRRRLRRHGRRVRDRVARGLHAARPPLPGPRGVDPPREHAGDARARGAPADALAPRGGARRRRRHAGRCGPSPRARSRTPRSSPTPSACYARTARRCSARWEDAGPKAIYVCASADRIVVNPAGGVRYAGLKSRVHLSQGPARQDRRTRGLRARRAPQERARAVHQRARRARRGRRSHRHAAAAGGGLRPQRVALPAHDRGARARGDAPGAVRRHRGARRGPGRRVRLRRRARSRDPGARRPQHLPYVEYQDETRAPAAFARAAQARDPVPRRRHRRRTVAAHPDPRHAPGRLVLDGRRDQAAPRGRHRRRRRPSHREPRRLVAGERRHVARARAARQAQAAHRVDGYGRGERRVLRGEREQEHLRAAADRHRVDRRLLRQGRPQRPARQDRRDRRHLQDGAARRRRVALPGLHRRRAAGARAQGRPVLRHVPRPRQPGPRHDQGRQSTRSGGAASGWGSRRSSKHLVDHLGGLREALAAAREAAHLPDDAPIIESPTAARVAPRAGPRPGDGGRRRRSRRRGHGRRCRRRSAASRAPSRPSSSSAATSRWRAWSGSTPATGASRSAERPSRRAQRRSLRPRAG